MAGGSERVVAVDDDRVVGRDGSKAVTRAGIPSVGVRTWVNDERLSFPFEAKRKIIAVRVTAVSVQTDAAEIGDDGPVRPALDPPTALRVGGLSGRDKLLLENYFR